MNLRLKLFLTIGMFASLTAVHAASFDCAKASSPTEKMICQNPNISKLDDRLSAAYKEAKKTNPSIVEEQRAWLKKTRECKDEQCLESLYVTRVQELEGGNKTLNQAQMPTQSPAAPVAISTAEQASTAEIQKYFQNGICYRATNIALERKMMMDDEQIRKVINKLNVDALDALEKEQFKITKDICGLKITNPEECIKKLPPRTHGYNSGYGRAGVELKSSKPITIISGGEPGNSNKAMLQTLRATCGNFL